MINLVSNLLGAPPDGYEPLTYVIGAIICIILIDIFKDVIMAIGGFFR